MLTSSVKAEKINTIKFDRKGDNAVTLNHFRKITSSFLIINLKHVSQKYSDPCFIIACLCLGVSNF